MKHFKHQPSAFARESQLKPWPIKLMLVRNIQLVTFRFSIFFSALFFVIFDLSTEGHLNGISALLCSVSCVLCPLFAPASEHEQEHKHKRTSASCCYCCGNKRRKPSDNVFVFVQGHPVPVPVPVSATAHLQFLLFFPHPP